MAMVNVRNMDPQVWSQFGAAAKRRRVPVGELLTDVLQDWLCSSPQALSREEIIRRAEGMWAHHAPGRSMVDELIAERRAEAAAEDAE